MSERKVYRILVVDDELSIRSTVALLLLSEGYAVDTAENGFDALLRMKAVLH